MKGIPAIIAGACAGATEITVTYPFECEHCQPQTNIRQVVDNELQAHGCHFKF